MLQSVCNACHSFSFAKLLFACFIPVLFLFAFRFCIKFNNVFCVALKTLLALFVGLVVAVPAAAAPAAIHARV